MHLLLAVSLMIGSIKWGKWKRWREFLPTIYYLSLMNLFYEFIANKYKPLWVLKSPFINEFFTLSLYMFIIYPCIVAWYIGNFPEDKARAAIHFGKWILISILLEWIAIKLNYISYSNGWNLYWTTFFYISMYAMLRLHHRNPLSALILSPIFTVFYLFMFNYNILK